MRNAVRVESKRNATRLPAFSEEFVTGLSGMSECGEFMSLVKSELLILEFLRFKVNGVISISLRNDYKMLKV